MVPVTVCHAPFPVQVVLGFREFELSAPRRKGERHAACRGIMVQRVHQLQVDSSCSCILRLSCSLSPPCRHIRACRRPWICCAFGCCASSTMAGLRTPGKQTSTPSKYFQPCPGPLRICLACVVHLFFSKTRQHGGLLQGRDTLLSQRFMHICSVFPNTANPSAHGRMYVPTLRSESQ